MRTDRQSSPGDVGTGSDLEPHLSTIVPRTLAALDREYPNGVVIRVDAPGQWAEPKTRHPIFYGCYDWHSSVHSHWQLIRILRTYPDHRLAAEIISTLDNRFDEEAVAIEMETLRNWPGFEMPYGMAWMLQLGSELVEWEGELPRRWLGALQPMIDHAADGFRRQLMTRDRAMRGGVHSQTAFSLGLAHDWARTTGDEDLRDAISRGAKVFYGMDRNAPLAYEPSSVDFLSPALSEADLMRRVLEPDALEQWMDGFLPPGSSRIVELMPPQPVVDPSDGQLAHIAGLNMSRAWMAEGVASALPEGHRLRGELMELAKLHRQEGFEVALHPDYMVSHWAPTFVIYLMTGRGLDN